MSFVFKRGPTLLVNQIVNGLGQYDRHKAHIPPGLIRSIERGAQLRSDIMVYKKGVWNILISA